MFGCSLTQIILYHIILVFSSCLVSMLSTIEPVANSLKLLVVGDSTGCELLSIISTTLNVLLSMHCQFLYLFHLKQLNPCGSYSNNALYSWMDLLHNVITTHCLNNAWSAVQLTSCAHSYMNSYRDQKLATF